MVVEVAYSTTIAMLAKRCKVGIDCSPVLDTVYNVQYWTQVYSNTNAVYGQRGTTTAVVGDLIFTTPVAQVNN